MRASAVTAAVSQIADQNSHASSATLSSASCVDWSMYVITFGICGARRARSTSSSITIASHTRLRTSGDASVATAKSPFMYVSMCWASCGGISATKWLRQPSACETGGGGAHVREVRDELYRIARRRRPGR